MAKQEEGKIVKQPEDKKINAMAFVKSSKLHTYYQAFIVKKYNGQSNSIKEWNAICKKEGIEI